MVGRIVALVCCLLCAFPFFVIGVYNKDSSEPINFWSGGTSLKDKVKDVKGYNTEMAGLYKKCALFFLLTGILFVVFSPTTPNILHPPTTKKEMRYPKCV